MSQPTSSRGARRQVGKLGAWYWASDVVVGGVERSSLHWLLSSLLNSLELTCIHRLSVGRKHQPVPDGQRGIGITGICLDIVANPMDAAVSKARVDTADVHAAGRLFVVYGGALETVTWHAGGVDP